MLSFGVIYGSHLQRLGTPCVFPCLSPIESKLTWGSRKNHCDNRHYQNNITRYHNKQPTEAFYKCRQQWTHEGSNLARTLGILSSIPALVDLSGWLDLVEIN